MGLFSAGRIIGGIQGWTAKNAQLTAEEKVETDLYRKKTENAARYARETGKKRKAYTNLVDHGKKLLESNSLFQSLFAKSGLPPEQLEFITSAMGVQYADRRVTNGPSYKDSQYFNSVNSTIKRGGMEALLSIIGRPATEPEVKAPTATQPDLEDTQESFSSNLTDFLGGLTPSGTGDAQRKAIEESARPTGPEGKDYDIGMNEGSAAPEWERPRPDRLLPDMGKDPLGSQTNRKEAELTLMGVILKEDLLTEWTSVNSASGAKVFVLAAVEDADVQGRLGSATQQFFDFYRTYNNRYGGDVAAAAEDYYAVSQKLKSGQGTKFRQVDGLISVIDEAGGLDKLLDAALPVAPSAKVPPSAAVVPLGDMPDAVKLWAGKARSGESKRFGGVKYTITIDSDHRTTVTKSE